MPLPLFELICDFQNQTPAETFLKFLSIIKLVPSKRQHMITKHVLIGYQKSHVCLSNLKGCSIHMSGHKSILVVKKFSPKTNLVKFHFFT